MSNGILKINSAKNYTKSDFPETQHYLLRNEL